MNVPFVFVVVVVVVVLVGGVARILMKLSN